MSLLKHYILDADNNVIEVDDLFTWGTWLEEHPDHRVVGFTQITSQVYVSTVFLGLDHRFLGDGPPILFETMVFGGPLNGEMDRYSSRDDALTGHKMFVKRARKAQGQKIDEQAEGS